MTEGGFFDYVDERVDSARYREKLTDEEFAKVSEMVEKQIKKDLEDGIPFDSKEMEENIEQVIEYCISEVRDPE